MLITSVNDNFYEIFNASFICDYVVYDKIWTRKNYRIDRNDFGTTRAGYPE